MSTECAYVYRQAAALIREGKAEYGCWAIEEVAGPDSATEKLFVRYFKPRKVQRFGTMDVGWFGLPIGENQADREIALLLMAEIVEDL